VSLKSQLLKAGVATQKQARRAQHQKRQEQKSTQKSAAELAQQRRAEQAERSRQLNEQRQAELRERERQAEIQQLIETHQISREGGEHNYQFVMNKRITKIVVTEAMISPLAKGQMGIVAWQERFYVLPAAALERVAERDEDVIVVWHKASQTTAAQDDPYADFPIPDDLMW